jgi:hypothetical protein
MDLSPAHTAARAAPLRLAAITASHTLLETGEGDIVIQCYPDPRPAPGDPGGVMLVAITAEAASVLDTDNLRITLPDNIEGVILANGTATWARILNRAGEWWADASVSDEAGAGEIQFDSTTMGAGAFARLLTAQFQG